MYTQRIAVITGSSQGLGKAFAQDCASRGYSLVLISLPDSGLPELAQELERQYGTHCLILEEDLSYPENRQKVVSAIFGRYSRIDLLVNNAGIGQNGLFDVLPYEIQQKTIELNIQATMQLSYALLPLLSAVSPHGSIGKILIVASLAAFYPMPLFAVYAATKSFLLHFSLALRHELVPLGVSVSALCPGGIITSEELREKVRSHGFLGSLSSMEPADVARIALNQTLSGKPIIIPGWFNRTLMVMGSFLTKNMLAKGIFARWQSALSKESAISEESAISGENTKPLENAPSRETACQQEIYDNKKNYLKREERWTAKVIRTIQTIDNGSREIMRRKDA